MRAIDSMNLAADIFRLSEGLTGYLVNYLSEREDFGMRSCYGEAFSIALLSRSGHLSPKIEAKLIRAYDAKDRSDPEFHWEFNNYAMLESSRLRSPLVFRHTPCTNWTLLRSNVRIRAALDAETGIREAGTKLRRMQNPSGLILDDPGVRSFQYHCFSAALIYEIYQETKDSFFLESFSRAVSFIRHFILPNGDTLYVGRGQQQSFGYASLIYILSALYALTGDRFVLGDLRNVVHYVAAYARPDGSLPLVLGGGEEPLPHPNNPHQDPKYLGWYAYNNYFDYLPFAGLFLRKSAELLMSVQVGVPECINQESYRDPDFIKVVSGQTIFVISRPGGYWTNDLPVPYVYSRGRVRTPCYGGEQFGDSIYSLKGIPLPIRSSGCSLRWKALSFLGRDMMVVISPLGVLLRRYEFSEDRIAIRNCLLSPFRLKDHYLFLIDNGIKLRSEYPLIPAGQEHSASGRLRVFESEHIGDIILEFSE